MNDFQIEAIVRYLLSIQTGEVEQPQASAFAGLSGEELFDNDCALCHGFDAEGRVGPSLVGVFDRYGGLEGAEATEAREAVRDTIVNGRLVPSVGIMPPFKDKLTDDAIDRILEYLASIQEESDRFYGQIGGSGGEDDS
ncbi:MAG: cytochrome c, partial [Nitriliruptorales bacterium]|nr:cytochrome c [Nitriliruptorales bacterium]